MSLYIEGIYCDDLQSIVQLPQQWAAVNGKSKNLVVSQSHGLAVSAGSNRCAGKSVQAGEEEMNLPSSNVLMCVSSSGYDPY